MSSKKKEFDWFDRPGVRRGLWIALWLVCFLTLAAEGIYRMMAHDSHMGKSPLKYAIIGFVSCAAMILIAKGMGFWLKVAPDYYQSGNSESSDD